MGQANRSKAQIFYMILRVKDGMYYHQTENGEDWFTSEITQAFKFFNRDKANAKIKAMQNWLGRPKFRIMTGKIIRHK